jgi:FdrA protein
MLLVAREEVNGMTENKIDTLLAEPLVVINIGLSMFATTLEEQRVNVIQIDWVPPAGGDKEMQDLLDEML